MFRKLRPPTITEIHSLDYTSRVVSTQTKCFLSPTNVLDLIGLKFVNGVAVGTALADGPPHRSVLALLTHTAPTSVNDGKAHYSDCSFAYTFQRT